MPISFGKWVPSGTIRIKNTALAVGGKVPAGDDRISRKGNLIAYVTGFPRTSPLALIVVGARCRQHVTARCRGEALRPRADFPTLAAAKPANTIDTVVFWSLSVDGWLVIQSRRPQIQRRNRLKLDKMTKISADIRTDQQARGLIKLKKRNIHKSTAALLTSRAIATTKTMKTQLRGVVFWFQLRRAGEL
ncbi:hypothetical protein FB451DRAFT_1163828 [Mycena latifolia]|nr:hypothetical protein FB451DRAFT_1163828 [Mycena latifolia]